ncbi:MAG: aminotransferase class I/II-fold pyridoxal phosphate-dependent enzyme [Candidatus Latescibacteria bacterium]|nr:aminotransferase class I/II-fold pyridoxal phosphate-dependent enzyme [Candidatus Latescibacterota bacterium]
MSSTTADRVAIFTESVIREMTRLAALYDGINLAQGYPDFPAPDAIKEAAIQAIRDDHNQYSITWGTKVLRTAVSEKVRSYNRISADPETGVTICCGATEAMIAALLAIINPGDEVIIFEPFYENYGPDSIISGAVRRYITLQEPNWEFDRDELARLFNTKTKAIIINTPNNPTGKVFTREELEFIAGLCQRWDVIAVTDEIYEHILYDGTEHVSIGSLDGMQDRTITISGLSKTFSVTGWRLGYTVACPRLTDALRKAHDFLTVNAPTPLQVAGVAALHLGPDYYARLAADYRARRDYLLDVLSSVGFECFTPRGAYYTMTDISAFGYADDTEFAQYLVKDVGIAAVPGSSFYREAHLGRDRLRFAFCKKQSTLTEAAARLSRLRS